MIFTHPWKNGKKDNFTPEIIMWNVIYIPILSMKVLKAGMIRCKASCLSPAILFTAKHFEQLGRLHQCRLIFADTSLNIRHCKHFQ